MLVLENGDACGTVSGGCLEADVLERAKRVLSSGHAETFTYDTTGDENSVFSMNMGCRGVITIRLEPVSAESPVIARLRAAYEDRTASDDVEVPLRLVIYGAGADAVPLARIADELGWSVCVTDHRPAFLAEGRFPSHTEIIPSTTDQVPEIKSDARTAAVLMTHNYNRDRQLLPSIIEGEFFYIGLLGPKRRTEQMLGEIAAEGVVPPPETLAKIYAPIGLDIGADTPESIAVAIIAEIQSVFASREGGHLRNRAGSIYGR